MELSPRQREVLRVLTDEYRKEESEITGETIAEAVGVHIGTLQREIQSLKALDLVEAFSGRGYKPTARAFEAATVADADTTESLNLAHGYERVEVVVAEIDFTNVHDPDECHARIRFRDPIDHLDVGDAVLIGPTPRSDLVVAGEIVDVDRSRNELSIDVVKLEAPVVP